MPTLFRFRYIMGRFSQALGVFREAEQRSSRQDHEIYHYLGELLYRAATTQSQKDVASQQQDEARTYFELAVQSGRKLESYVRLAELYRKNKQYQKAIEILENCLQLVVNLAVPRFFFVLYPFAPFQLDSWELGGSDWNQCAVLENQRNAKGTRSFSGSRQHWTEMLAQGTSGLWCHFAGKCGICISFDTIC